MRTRNVIREELRQSVAKCKNTIYIEMLLEIAEIYRKLSNESTFKEVSELEWEQYLAVSSIMRTKNIKHIKDTNCILRALETKPTNKGARI